MYIYCQILQGLNAAIFFRQAIGRKDFLHLKIKGSRLSVSSLQNLADGRFLVSGKEIAI
jgi:hypothetical protein